MNSVRPARELVERVVTTVDAAAGATVLVLGSLPPAGRDLDLLVRAPERVKIDRALRDLGLCRNGSRYALFGACSAYSVELADAERFLAPDALNALFEQSVTLDGLTSIARPSPPHALLVLARLMVEEGGLLPKRRARLARILADDAHAWEGARVAAASWHAERALSLLERAAREDRPLPLPTRIRARGVRGLRRPRRRGLLVALSGIDGAGKSSQARWLADSLALLGADVEVVWNDMSGNRALTLVAAVAKALLRRSGRQPERMARYDELPRPDNQAEAGVRGIWGVFVTVGNAVEQRILASRATARGRVVVFDRSPLDLAVRMEVLYRAVVRLQRVLVRIAAPRPDLAFLLDIPAEVSLVRKDDIWAPGQLEEQTTLYRSLAPRFRVQRLDGCRPPADIAAEIAEAVWRRMG